MFNKVTNIIIWIETIRTNVVRYNHPSEYFLKEGYQNNSICLCTFIKKSQSEFATITIYVYDLNIIQTYEELSNAIEYLKKEFEMKDPGKIKFYLSLQIEHLAHEILFINNQHIQKRFRKNFVWIKNSH